MNSHQQTSISPINSPKIKPIINAHATWRCMIPSDLTSISKHKPKMLSHLTISRVQTENIGPKGLRNLREALIASKRTSSLNFNPYGFTYKQLIFLFHSTNHWKKITQPWLDPRKCTKETILRFGRCKNLTDLQLNRSRSPPNMPMIIFNRTYWQFRQLNKLESLEVEVTPFIFNCRPPRSFTFFLRY